MRIDETRRVLRGGIVLAALAFSPHARAADEASEPPPERTPSYATSGLAVAGGLGVQHGGVGGSALYYFRLGDTHLHLAPFASLGYLPMGERAAAAPAGGLAVAFGKRHRLIGDVGVGPVAYEVLNLHGSVIDARVAFGVEAGLGYEYMAASGFMLRLIPLGVALPLDPRMPSSVRTAMYSPALAIGWKLW